MSLASELGFRSVVPRVYNQIVQYVEQSMPQLNYDKESGMGISEATETVYLWLEKIANKDGDLYQEIISYIGNS